MPDDDEFAGCARETDIARGIAGCDVVMMLRIQKERFADADIPAGEEYFREFGLTAERLALAKPDAIVMHPQPMNRGVEIESRGGRWPAVGDPAAGGQWRGGAHGGAGSAGRAAGARGLAEMAGYSASQGTPRHHLRRGRRRSCRRRASRASST